ncbi:unnamed protein product [Heterobilharzia americana]|nr:unnamed protein product [Heterobilharzia americana]
MLNPDGVFHGHYRTDTRGVNLNRVYLKPDFLYYPSIYATKALITYYHTNYGTVKLYAPFLDNIFRRQILTDSPKPSAASVAPPPDNLPTTESTTDIENPQDFVDQNTLDTSFSFSEISKLSNDKSFDYNVQEQINSENQSADEPNITTEGESTDKLLSYLDSNHSIKSDELFTSNRSTFVQEVTNNLFLPEPTSTQPMTPQITVPNQKENNPYLDSLENVEQLISNSSQSLINERVPVVHRINYSVDSFDDKNNVTETIDTELYQILVKTNKARSTSTSSYVADLNKDFSDISKNHLNSYRIPSIFNKEVASRQIVSTAAPSPGAKPSSSTTPASTMSNLTPTVRRLITSTPSNIIIKRSSGQDKKSKKSYNEYRNSGLKSSVHSQPNRIPPLFNRSKHCPTLKVDCLPCFLMEWNMPYQQAVTTGRVSKSLVEKAEPVNSSIKLNAAQILNFDSEIDDSQKNLKSLDSEKSLLQYTSPLESDQSDEKKLFFLNDDYQILHHSQMMPFYDAVSALVTSDAQECKHKHNGDEENNSDQYNENKQRNHLSPDNEANISSETAIQLVNEDLYCFESSCSVIGNEGSDMDEDENNEQSNQEDLSINPQYVEILKSVETMVREEKNKTTLIDEGSMNTSVDDLNVDELKRMEMLKEQLDQLRKAHHLSDANELQLEESNVAFYFDLHGHCSKRGCFLYGNWLETEDSMVDNVLYALLVGVNSIYFDFDSCNFSLRNMYLKDRKGSYTKEGAGRVAISKHLGLTHCYTVECNYNAGPLPNRLSRFVTSALPNDSGRLTPVGTFYGPHWSDIASSGSIQSCHSGISVQLNTIHNVYTNTLNQTSSGAPRFTPAHYEDVGRALMIAILDINQINPWPKIASLGGPNSEPDIGILTLSSSLPEFSSIKTLKEWTRTYVRGIASLNASIKASTNRLTEVPTTKLSDSKKQVNKKLPLNSEPSEGVASFSSTGNVATQNPVKSRENSVKRNISNAVTNSSISKKFLMQTNITSQATNDFLSSTATVLDKTFSSTTNTPSRSDRKNHLYHSNPTPSHTSIRSKLQYYHESSDFTKVHSPLYSRLTPMATEDTGATPTTIPINHCEELKSQTLYNNDNLLKCNRRKNGKSFLYDDGNGENLIKVMNKNLNCQLIRRKVAENIFIFSSASKEYQTKCKSYMLKRS